MAKEEGLASVDIANDPVFLSHSRYSIFDISKVTFSILPNVILAHEFFMSLIWGSVPIVTYIARGCQIRVLVYGVSLCCLIPAIAARSPVCKSVSVSIPLQSMSKSAMVSASARPQLVPPFDYKVMSLFIKRLITD